MTPDVYVPNLGPPAISSDFLETSQDALGIFRKQPAKVNDTLSSTEAKRGRNNSLILESSFRLITSVLQGPAVPLPLY